MLSCFIQIITTVQMFRLSGMAQLFLAIILERKKTRKIVKKQPKKEKN